MKSFSVDRHFADAKPVLTPAIALIDVIADWLAAIQGRADLPHAFERLVGAVGAEAGALIRTQCATGRPMLVENCDLAAARTARPLAQSFADRCLGADFQTAQPGTIWTAVNGPTAKLAEWQVSRGLHGFMCLVLARSSGARDHIELHFRRPPSDEVQVMLGALLPTMTRAWATRPVGLISSLAPARMPRQHVARTPEPALSPANPFHLSRAEFRVCLLISRGHTVASLAEELGLSEATIRSHLRTIYAKTDTSSFAELVFRLLDNGAGHNRRSA